MKDVDAEEQLEETTETETGAETTVSTLQKMGMQLTQAQEGKPLDSFIPR